MQSNALSLVTRISISEAPDFMDSGDEEDYLMGGSMNNRFNSQNSLPCIGEIYEGVLEDGDNGGEGGGVIEGPIKIPCIRERRASIDSNSNFSVESDMTNESGKKSKRSSKQGSKSKSRSKRRSIEAANRLLEDKDIIVSSLVAQVEKLQQQLAEQQKREERDPSGEKDLAEELRHTKRLIAENEIIAVSLGEQMKARQLQIDEKSHVVEEQAKEITRLKEQLASSGVDLSKDGDADGPSDRKISRSDSKSSKKKSKRSSSSIKRSSSRNSLKKGK